MKTSTINLALFGVLLASMSGCNPFRWSNHYAVKIDPNFTVAQQDDIVVAARSWQDIGTGVELDITIADCKQAGNDEICIHVSNAAYIDQVYGANADGVIGDTDNNDNESDIYIPLDVIAQDFNETSNPPIDTLITQIVSHELGHAMGLSHSGAGTIMFAFMNGAATHPVCADANQYNAIRQGFIQNCPEGAVSTQVAKVQP